MSLDFQRSMHGFFIKEGLDIFVSLMNTLTVMHMWGFGCCSVFVR